MMRRAEPRQEAARVPVTWQDAVQEWQAENPNSPLPQWTRDLEGAGAPPPPPPDSGGSSSLSAITWQDRITILLTEVFTAHFLFLAVIGLGAFVAYLANAGIHVQALVTTLVVLSGIEAAVVAVQSAAGTDARTHVLTALGKIPPFRP